MRAVRSFGPAGGLLAEIALEAGVSTKTTKQHLKSLVEEGDALRDKRPLPPFRSYWREA